MPYIELDKNLPGIRSLMAFQAGNSGTAECTGGNFIKGYAGLALTERELIGTYVSYLNDCFYCHHSHGEIAVCYLNGDRSLVDAVGVTIKKHLFRKN